MIRFLFLVAWSATALAHTPVTVERVIDGDTFIASWEPLPGVTVRTRIRIAGVQAPETRTRRDCEKRAGRAATAFLESLVGSRVIYLENVRNGTYSGRHVADVYAGHDSIPDLLIDAGLGMPYDGKGKAPNWVCTD